MRHFLQLSRLQRLRSVHPASVATLIAGCAIALALFAVLHTDETARSRFDFVQRADVRYTEVKHAFDDAQDALHAEGQLFRSVGAIDDVQFRSFARPLLEVYPDLQALVVRRFVTGAQRKAYVARRRQRWPGFEITERSGQGFAPAGERPLYLVTDMVVPRTTNIQSLGYDVWAFPLRRELAERAIDSAAPAASGIVPLLQPRGRRGMLIAMAFYTPGQVPATVAERRAQARGTVEVVIDTAALLQGYLSRAGLLDTPGTAIEVYGQTGGSERLEQVFRNGSVAPGPPAWWRRMLGAATLERSRGFSVADKVWTLQTRAQLPAVVHLGSLVTLLVGLAFSIAAAVFVQGRATRVRHIENLVEDRTADLRRALDALRLFRRATDASANALLLVKADAPGYPVVYVNPAFERMRGFRADAIVGRSLAELASEAPDQPAMAELRRAFRERREAQALLRLRRSDGAELFCEVSVAPVLDNAGNVAHFVVCEYDVTAAKLYEAELERRARYDTLTGLANRVLLADRIERALAFAGRSGSPVWVVALDLDDFKYINDSLGHAVGDRVLRQVAGRITAAVKPVDTVARIGDDEFVLVLLECRDERQVGETVNRVLAAVAAPILERERRVFVTGSAGVAAFPADGSDADTLLKHAETAMYRAKEAGRNSIQFYLPSMNKRALERLAFGDALRHALVSGEFELHYQPQADMASGAVIGAEALIRWRHPQMGMVRPERFIGLAEETGLIVPIGAWALRTACAQNAAWQAQGLGPLRIAVNLSARQFAEADLTQLIARILRETRLAPTRLDVELTESLVMANVEEAIRTMRDLKAMGVQLSIDDFGTGYSSLAYLKRFPVDVLKIDQAFVRDIEDGGEGAAMVGAIISLGHSLGMKVIAEGVETQAQVAYLRSRGCDELQGYFVSPPLPAADFEPVLEARRQRPLRQGARAR